MPDGSSPRWKKGGTMLPRKSVIKTIPAIKTHHAAISFPWILILVKTTLKVRVTGK